MRRLSVMIIAIVLLVIVPLGAQDDATPDTPSDEAAPFEPYFVEVPCASVAPEGITMTCGSMFVLQDRLNPDPEKLVRLSVIIIHSLSDNPKPDPIINLSGGPGGMVTLYLGQVFRNNYRTFLEDRDFIMFDQRGIPISAPALDCPEVFNVNYMSAFRTGSYEQMTADEVATILACHDAGVRNDFDLNGYTTIQNAADVEDLRIALGYDEWNLFGVSYGAKLALTVMRDYPDGVRSVILDSAYPLQVNLYTDLAANKQRIFDVFFEACENDAACATTYPNLEADFYALVDLMNKFPIRVMGLRAPSNDNFEAYVNGDMLVEDIFSMFYVKQEITTIPYIIYVLTQGDYRILPLMVNDLFIQSQGISEGTYYSIQCGEEASFASREALIESAGALHPSLQAGHLIQINGVLDICDAWQIDDAPASENEPVVSDIPTLILAGEFDPITPPSWGELVHDDLSNSFFYTIPSVGHGVVRSDRCATAISQQFINAPIEEPDVSCIADIAPMMFVVP